VTLTGNKEAVGFPGKTRGVFTDGRILFNGVNQEGKGNPVPRKKRRALNKQEHRMGRQEEGDWGDL